MTRKEAIEILKAYRSKLSNSVSNQLDGDIKAFDIAINSLEIDERYELEYEQAEPCDDAISRKAVLDIVNNPLNIRLDEIIKKLQPVNPQETVTEFADRCKECGAKYGQLLKQKTGRWINQRVIYTNATIDFKVCSECRYEFSYDAETGVCDANYCPNCGARMESEDKE